MFVRQISHGWRSRRRDFSRRWARAVKTLLVYGCFFLVVFSLQHYFSPNVSSQKRTHTHHQRTGVLVCNEIKTPLVSLHYQKALSTMYDALACVCVSCGESGLLSCSCLDFCSRYYQNDPLPQQHFTHTHTHTYINTHRVTSLIGTTASTHYSHQIPFRSGEVIFHPNSLQ